MHIKYFFHHFRHIRLPKKLFKLPRSIKYASFLLFVYYLGWGMAYAYEAIYIKEKLGVYSNVGITFAIFHLFAIITSIIMGALLDKTNKRNIIRFFLVFYIPFSYIFLSIKNFSQFIIFKAYHGIIATGLWVSSESYIRLHSPKKKEIESVTLFDLALVVAMILGGITGAFLIYKISYNLFYSISFFAFLALIFSSALSDREKAKKVKILKGIEHEIIDIESNAKFRRFTLLVIFFTFLSASIMFIYPLFLKAVGVELWQIGMMFAVFQAPFLFEGFFAVTKQRYKIAKIAIVIMAFIFLGIAFTNNIIIIFFSGLFISLCLAAIFPILSGKLTEIMPIKRRGELTSVLYTIRNLTFAVSLIIIGFIADVGLNYVFLMDFFVAILFFFFAKKLI